MFGKIASDVLGLSDIGKVIHPKDFDKVDSDDYVFHEDKEKIFFLIKSKKDEYCFTNYAIIHLDGESATSSKRKLYRYSYKEYRLENVWLETAGTVDLDVELKFTLVGNNERVNFSIDVDKREIEALKDIYKSLIKIAELQDKNETYLNIANRSISGVLEALKLTTLQSAEELQKMNEYAYNWLIARNKEFVVEDFTHVFEKYINN